MKPHSWERANAWQHQLAGGSEEAISVASVCCPACWWDVSALGLCALCACVGTKSVSSHLGALFLVYFFVILWWVVISVPSSAVIYLQSVDRPWILCGYYVYFFVFLSVPCSVLNMTTVSFSHCGCTVYWLCQSSWISCSEVDRIWEYEG